MNYYFCCEVTIIFLYKEMIGDYFSLVVMMLMLKGATSKVRV